MSISYAVTITPSIPESQMIYIDGLPNITLAEEAEPNTPKPGDLFVLSTGKNFPPDPPQAYGNIKSNS